MSRVGCSAAARQAARFTAVVVFPTPPFWFATAIIRANRPPNRGKLTESRGGCNLFHVERLGPVDFGKNVPRGTPVHSAEARILGSVFHVELFEVFNTGVRLP